MNDSLDSVLLDIGRSYQTDILPDSRFYVEVDIGRRAEELGMKDAGEQFRAVSAIVPVKKPAGAMRVRIDGRTFVNYVQFDSGVAVPGHVAAHSQSKFRDYIPHDSMVLGFE